MPGSFILHLLSFFGDVTEADAGDLPHMLGRELKGVGGTAVTGQNKKKNTGVHTGFKSVEWTVKFTGLPERLSFLRLMG